MNKLPIEKRVAVITALVEGNSIRSTVRMTGVAKNTIVKLLAQVGEACARYQHEHMRNLSCNRVQVDEIWSFCCSKEKNVPEAHKGEFGYGDVWTFVAIDAETKLVPCWLVGWRDACCATQLTNDLAERQAHRIQLTTDGHNMYLEAVEAGFANEIDYAMIVKLYGKAGSDKNPSTRYRPGECCGTKRNVITGRPDPERISTSYVERQNLTTRMHASVHAVDARVPQETGEPGARHRAPFHALQFRADSPNATGDSGDEGRRRGSSVDAG